MPDIPQRKVVLIIVYLSILLDNLLLTVVVPIVPDYLITVESPRKAVTPWLLETNRSTIFNEQQLNEENGKIGFLLSTKAVVQMVFNPIVGCLARRIGYTMPLFFGTINLLASSLLYALGESYIALVFARSLQGISSACIGVSGMCLVAEHYTDEAERSKVMGVVLGSVALGVLLGYPYGGFSYDFLGKMAPFLGVAFIAVLDIERSRGCSGWKGLLADKTVMLTAGAIWLSSSAMAVLEPCLPIWLMSHIHPKKWELGTVFIPDSIGYLIGTNFFGGIAYKFGRWRVAIAALVLVAVSACVVMQGLARKANQLAAEEYYLFFDTNVLAPKLSVQKDDFPKLKQLPTATSMRGLIIPHAGLGLGIGVADSALVPLLATIVDTNHRADYAAVYAIQQTSVSLAYGLAPMFGGELARVMGFSWLMRVIGLVNLLYSPFLLFLAPSENPESHPVKAEQSVSYKSTENIRSYSRFIDSDESD